MKKQIILYSGALLILFLTIYIKNLLSEYYPVTATFGIEGKKVSYRLDKVHYGNDAFKVIVLTDVENLQGKLIWSDGENSQAEELKPDGRSLTGYIPASVPLSKIEYRIILTHNSIEYFVPRNEAFVPLIFYGRIPGFIKYLHYFLLLGGLFISIRTGLEVFDENKKSKKYSVIVLSFFIIYAVFINPLKNSYKLGVINKSVPQITELFELQAIIFVLIWILGLLLIFNKKYSLAGTMTASILSFINFIAFPFVL